MSLVRTEHQPGRDTTWLAVQSDRTEHIVIIEMLSKTTGGTSELGQVRMTPSDMRAYIKQLEAALIVTTGSL